MREAGQGVCFFISCIFAPMQFPPTLHTVSFGDTSMQLFVPDEQTVRSAYEKGEITFPYWSKMWPAAKALAAYLHNHPEYTKDKTVLELGAGLGLPSLVASRTACHVLCTDHAPETMDFVQLSSRHNNIKNLQIAVKDWADVDEHFEVDTILLSDVNYEPAAFDNLLQRVRAFLKEGKTIILSTPQRLMAKDFLMAIMPYAQHHEVETIQEKESLVDVSIFVLQTA